MTSHAIASSTLACLLATCLATAQTAAPGRQNRQPAPFIPDCNGNGIHDADDIASGRSEDCDGNLLPDECDYGGWVLFAESFESGLPAGWTFTGQWQVTGDCPRASECAGTNFAYFGGTTSCTFHSGSEFGDMVLPAIDLPAGAQSAVLTFCSAYEGEGQELYDVADVTVNGVLVDHVSPDPQLDWETRSVDLSAYLGQTVEIRFQFDAMDSLGNEFLGWQIDNVRILARPQGAVGDCNANGVLDECEIASGASEDCNANFVPDECDLFLGISQDCQSNSVPDECEIASGAAEDCNFNQVPDDCDVAFGSSQDCQRNGVPDECEIASGASGDCNANLVPDECDVTVQLEVAVSALAQSAEKITSFFPDTYEFFGGDTGVFINDGGQDMYNDGNGLRVDGTESIPYTNGDVVLDSAFGIGSSYFTAKYPGLFVLGTAGIDIDSLEIRGRIGRGTPAATVDVLELSVAVDGAPYSLYIKRIHGGPRPSVNQMMIVPGDGTGITHTFHPGPTFCSQTLTGLTGTERVYYVLVSRVAPTGHPIGLPLRPVDARDIAREVIAAFPFAVSSDDNDNGIPDECE